MRERVAADCFGCGMPRLVCVGCDCCADCCDCEDTDPCCGDVDPADLQEIDYGRPFPEERY